MVIFSGVVATLKPTADDFQLFFIPLVTPSTQVLGQSADQSPQRALLLVLFMATFSMVNFFIGDIDITLGEWPIVKIPLGPVTVKVSFRRRRTGLWRISPPSRRKG